MAKEQSTGEKYYFSVGTYDDIPAILIFSKKIFDTEAGGIDYEEHEWDDALSNLLEPIFGGVMELVENVWEYNTKKSIPDILEKEGFTRNTQVEKESNGNLETWLNGEEG